MNGAGMRRFERVGARLCYQGRMRLFRLHGSTSLVLGGVLICLVGCEQGDAAPLNGALAPGPGPTGVTPPVSPPPVASSNVGTSGNTTGETAASSAVGSNSESTLTFSDETATSGEFTEVTTRSAESNGVSSGGEENTEPVIPVACEAACSAAGGVCQDGTTCVFTCADVDACPEEIQCPDHLNCRIECSGADSCASHVACPSNGGQTCDVTCGQDACKGGVECGASSCTVNCANGACTGVSGGADTVTLNCSGDGSCSGANLSCNAQNCNLSCTGSGACMGGDINISANNATLNCQGNGSCSQAVNCSAGSCNIMCNTSVSACSSYCQNNGGQPPTGCP